MFRDRACGECGRRAAVPRRGDLGRVLLILLVLVSAFLHALWNALAKRERETDLATVLIVGLAGLGSGVYAIATHAPFPWGAPLRWALLSGVAEGLYVWTLARGLAAGPLSVVYPVSRGTAILVVWPASVLLLGERISAFSIGGAAVVAVGLALVPERTAGRGLGAAASWGVACGLFISAYHLAYKNALAGGAKSAPVVAVSLAVAVLLNLVRLGSARSRRLARLLVERPGPFALAGLVCGGGFVIFLVALTAGGAGAVLTLRNTSVVFALLLALAIGERPSPRSAAGSVLVAIGAALVALGT